MEDTKYGYLVQFSIVDLSITSVHPTKKDYTLHTECLPETLSIMLLTKYLARSVRSIVLFGNTLSVS